MLSRTKKGRSYMDNLSNQFMVVKDGCYKVFDKTAKVFYDCKSKKRAFELAKELNDDNKTKR
jgi:hypothetical protein